MTFELEVGTYEAPRKANPFDELIVQVLNQDVPEGKFPSGTITIPVETALSTAQAKIREAARNSGVRARIRNVDEEKRKVLFTLHPRKTSEAAADEAEGTEDEAPKSPKKG